MKLRGIVDGLSLEVLCGSNSLNREVTRGYAGDLMSDVMANTHKGDLWVTLQVHLNIVAIAVMKELAAIVLIGGRTAEVETVKKAEEENIPILVSRLPAFELIGRLYRLGITGMHGDVEGF